MQNLLSRRNLKAASLALLLFVYPILVLSTFSVQYTETIHRITTVQKFDMSLFGSHLADALAAIGFMLLFITLSIPSRVFRVIAIAVFAAAAAAAVGGYGQLVVGGLVSLPLLVALMAVALALRIKKPSERPSSLSVFGHVEGNRVAMIFLAIVIIIEIGALARWVAYPAFPSEIYGDGSWMFAELESALFHSFALLSPVLIVLVAFSFLHRWNIMDVLGKTWQLLSGYNPTGLHPEDSRTHQTATPKKDQTMDNGNKMIRPEIHDQRASSLMASQVTRKKMSIKNLDLVILTAALVVSPLILIYPHLPGVNPTGMGVSVDEMYYLRWMSELRSDVRTGWADIISRAFTVNEGDRPFTLLLILAIANMTSTPDLQVVRFLPVALAPMLVVASYSLVRYSRMLQNDKDLRLYASLAALFAAFSPQIVVGEYAGLLANWLAIIPAFFGMLVVIRLWDCKSTRGMAALLISLFAILTLVMVIHLYTWAHFVAMILLFAALSYIFSRKSVFMPKTKTILLLALVITTVIVEYGRSSYFATLPLTDSESVVTRNVLGRTEGRPLWERLDFTLTAYVGGFLSNPVLFLLALFWSVKGSLSRGLDRALLCMLFLMSLPILIGSVEFQTRILFNTPLFITAALAMYYLPSGMDARNRWLFLIAICAVFATYSLRAMANLYLELPEGYSLDEQFLLP